MVKHYKSDFTLSLTSPGGDYGDIVSLCSECDFSGTVRSGSFSKGFNFSRRDTEFSNCHIKDGRLLIVCDNHKLAPGRVVVQLCVDVPNPDYPDGLEHLTAVIPTDLLLSAQGQDETKDVEVTAVLPYVSPYAVAARGGFQGTEAEFNALLRKLPEYEGLMRSMDTRFEAEINAATGEIKRVDATIESIEDRERDKYYQLWLAVKGTPNIIIKVKAGGKATICFDGVLDSSGQPVNPVVKYAHPDRDTFMMIKIPTYGGINGSFGSTYCRGFRMCNGKSQYFGTNETDVELAAMDVGAVNFPVLADMLLMPAPNIYYQEWDMSKKGGIVCLFSSSGITGTLDLRNWDLSSCTAFSAWNWNCSSFPPEISHLLLPIGFMGEHWPRKAITMENMFQGLDKIESCSQIEPSPEDWDMSEMTNLNQIFFQSYIKVLDLSKWRTPMAATFRNFLTSSACQWVDLSGFDTGAVNLSADPYAASFTNTQFGDVPLRWVSVGPALFKAHALIFNAKNLGQKDDGSSNGCLEQFLEKMPTIRNKENYEALLEQENGVWYLNDGRARTLQLNSNLKNKAWAKAILAEMQAKGYTIV